MLSNCYESCTCNVNNFNNKIIIIISFLSQPAKEVKYIRNTEEQKRILETCQLDPTSGHMGVKCTLSRSTERFM